MDAFSAGVATGFAIAAPVGPIGLLCLRRAITGGFWAGFSSGLGAACADGCYAAAAAFALTAVTTAVARLAFPLHVAGGFALIALGGRTVFSRAPRNAAGDVRVRGGVRAFASTFGLTAVNSATILSFGALVAAAGFGRRSPDVHAAGVLVLGVFVGSALWWCLLSGVAGVLRRAFSRAVVRAIDVASGLGLSAFGLWTLAGAGRP